MSQVFCERWSVTKLTEYLEADCSKRIYIYLYFIFRLTNFLPASIATDCPLFIALFAMSFAAIYVIRFLKQFTTLSNIPDPPMMYCFLYFRFVTFSIFNNSILFLLFIIFIANMPPCLCSSSHMLPISFLAHLYFLLWTYSLTHFIWQLMHWC